MKIYSNRVRRWLKRQAVARRRRFLEGAHAAALAACNRKPLGKRDTPHVSCQRSRTEAVT